MGYTTDFEGKFKISGPLTAEALAQMHLLDNPTDIEGPTPWPEGYCQWQPTRDLGGIEWDGNDAALQHVRVDTPAMYHYWYAEGAAKWRASISRSRRSR